MTTTSTDSTFGHLTEEGLARARQRIGVWQPEPNPPHNYEVSRDGVRHFAYGYGDDNPLYCNPDYAQKTRWAGLIAPPTFIYTMGEDTAPKPDPEAKALLKGDPFAGLGSYQSSMHIEWWRPLQLGDRCYSRRALVGVQDKRSEFGGRTAHEYIAWVHFNQRDELVALERGMWIHAERHTSAKRKKEKETADPYTREQLAAIDAAYEHELGSRRGAEPRYWEDVEIGEALPERVRGPLTTTDVVVWHLGWGMELTPPGVYSLSYRIRKKVPGLYPPNALNVPDTVQRLHWEPERAQELGLPTSYDYGAMRETYLAHFVTDWMGDDGWLHRLDCQHRRFFFQGDTAWLRGEVVAKRQLEGRNEVDVDIRIENQRGAVISPGRATVLLPSRVHGAVALPEPPAPDMESLFRHQIELLAD